MHHTIEERFLFPMLAKRMPAFKGDHLESHKGIHDGMLFFTFHQQFDRTCVGLEKLTTLVSKYTSTPSAYSPTEMRACLDSFKDVLFKHMDEEVRYYCFPPLSA
jgi:iron-sulfur cluster repair protein YtfE (RIC family)